jgi:phosphoglycerate dehydrogenase-like enzyme
MELLLSTHSAEQHGAELLALFGPETVLVTPGAKGPSGPEVAWLSADLFYSPEGPAFSEALRTASSLRWLQSAAAGRDLPIYRPLLERGVRITGSHENAISIAEYALGAVLRAYQQPERWAAAQERRSWEHHEFEELMGSTWLIIGYGAIGQAIAQRAAAFGARIMGLRRSPGPAAFADEILRPEELRSRLGEADVVVLARPATSDASPILGEAELALLKPGSVLVNIARGSLIDTAALLASLESGRPARAILDAFDAEPLDPASPLWSTPGVVITPHAAAGGLGRHERNARLFRANLRRYLAGEPLPDEIALAELPASGQPPAQLR